MQKQNDTSLTEQNHQDMQKILEIFLVEKYIPYWNDE